MNKPTSIVNLVLLDSNNDVDSVVNALMQINIPINLIGSACWLNKEPYVNNRLTILVSPNAFDKEITKTISAKLNKQCFVIFLSPASEDLFTIMDTCSDWCRWPCDLYELSFRLNRFISNRLSIAGIENPSTEIKQWEKLCLIGQSPQFNNTLSFIKKTADSNAPVLIEGETGCGKEVTARAIHYLGCRKDFPFIPVNCGAIPDQLFENELFGHEKGAFTDAKQGQVGIAEQADGGTLFLDEIETLSVKGQVTLLRFIEDNVIRPLGATKTKKVNVRIIAASNVSVCQLVDKGLFRQDLLFRLNLLSLTLPPLRNRKEDINLLIEHFMQKYRHQYQQKERTLHPELLDWMMNYHWPGNVRELENFIHRSFLLSEDNQIVRSPVKNKEPETQSRRKLFERRLNFSFDASFNEAKYQVINHFEKSYLKWIITDTKGNVTRAADVAKKERRALGKLLKKYDIDPILYREN